MKKIIFLTPLLLLIIYLFLFKSINKDIYIEGTLLDCGLNPINKETVFIGIFKDINAIKNLNPLKYKFIENKNTFKINIEDLDLNNFFILAYTVEKKIIHSPLESSLINNWESTFIKKSQNIKLVLCTKNTTTNYLEESFFNFTEESELEKSKDENIDYAFLNTKHPKNYDEYYLYKINGTINLDNFNTICKEHDNHIQFFVEIYKEELELFYPVNKNHYSIKNTAPLDAVILDCSVNNFELRFKSNYKEIYPYIVARAIDLYTKKTLYFAIASDINGIPLSILSKRKDNSPFTLKLEKNTNKDFGTLFIQTKKAGLITEIINLPQYSTQLEKAYLSNKQGLVVIDKIPLNSLFSLNIIDPKTMHTISFEVFLEYPKQYIIIPDLFSSKTSLTIIHKHNFQNISSLSIDPVNKFNLSFNKYFDIVKNISKEPIFLNLKDINDNNYNFSLIVKDNLIIEPKIINLFEINGKLNYFDKNETNKPCIACKVKLDNHETKTYENSFFSLNLSKPQINNSIYLELDNSYYVNSLLINAAHSLKLDIKLPATYFINYLNTISPTRKNKAMIFSYLESDRVYLAKDKKIVEAKYFNNKYFFIPDLELDNYTIFYIDKKITTKIRNLNINKEGVYILL